MKRLYPKLPPGADVVFRRLFDGENGCRLLISLLNAILRFPPGQRILKLVLLPTHLTGPRAKDKEVVLDVRAEAEDRRQFHIEVQISLKPAYAERVLIYWAGMYRGQFKSGAGYTDLNPVISLHFLFFNLLDKKKYPMFHHVFRARADGDDAVLSPHFEIHTVEMRKFPDLAEGDLEEKWLYFLKHGHEMTAEQAARLGVPEIEEAERKLVMISQSRKLQVAYERRVMAQHDAVALMKDPLTIARREALQEGQEKGERLGQEKGERLGREESLRLWIADMCELLGVDLTADRRAQIEQMDLDKLRELRAALKSARAWPGPVPRSRKQKGSSS